MFPFNLKVLIAKFGLWSPKIDESSLPLARKIFATRQTKLPRMCCNYPKCIHSFWTAAGHTALGYLANE